MWLKNSLAEAQQEEGGNKAVAATSAVIAMPTSPHTRHERNEKHATTTM